jgi:GT2 family glycosyltransferase
MMLAVVIVNWNETNASIRALQSVHASSPVVSFLVDSDSADDPSDTVARACPDVRIERLPANLGYAAACNHGVRSAIAAGAERVLVMNNDAVLAPGALDRMDHAERERPGSVIAPLIVYADAPDEVWSAGGYLEPPCVRNHHLGLGDTRNNYRAPRRVEWATGCALFFATETYRRVGPFDEAFFLYLEDVDWCLRARDVGVATWVVPEAVVMHDVSRSTGELPSETIRYLAYRNHFRLAFRHTHGWRRSPVFLELVATLAKIAVRTVAFADYRHDRWYHARTRAIRDFMLGRFGPVGDAV